MKIKKFSNLITVRSIILCVSFSTISYYNTVRVRLKRREKSKKKIL